MKYCPQCGERLIYVCKKIGCYKPLDITDPKHIYCFECETKQDDFKDDVGEKVRYVGGGVVAVVAPLLNKEVRKGVQDVAEKVIDAGKEALKNAMGKINVLSLDLKKQNIEKYNFSDTKIVNS